MSVLSSLSPAQSAFVQFRSVIAQTLWNAQLALSAQGHIAEAATLEAMLKRESGLALAQGHTPEFRVLLAQALRYLDPVTCSAGEAAAAAALTTAVEAWHGACPDMYGQVYDAVADHFRGWLAYELLTVPRATVVTADWLGPPIGSPTSHPADVAPFTSLEAHGALIRLELHTQADHETFFTLPYVLAHELVAHAWAAVPVVDPNDAFAEGWMDAVAFDLAVEVSRTAACCATAPDAFMLAGQRRHDERYDIYAATEHDAKRAAQRTSGRRAWRNLLAITSHMPSGIGRGLALRLSLDPELAPGRRVFLAQRLGRPDLLSRPLSCVAVQAEVLRFARGQISSSEWVDAVLTQL